MKHDEILQATKEAGYDWIFPSMPLKKLERFAAIIEKRTIERCAVVCEGIYTNGDGAEGWLEIAAAAIRKLGEQQCTKN